MVIIEDDQPNIQILKSTMQRSLQKDKEILNPTLAITTGYVISHITDRLHDVVRYQCQKISQARSEVLLTSGYWEKDSESSKLLCNAINRLPGNVQVKVVVDNGTLKNIFTPGHRIRIEPEDLGLDSHRGPTSITSFHRPLLGTMHSKFITIDRKTVIISSNNIQDRKNLEFAVTLGGPVTRAFVDIFEKLSGFTLTPWKDRNEEEEKEEKVEMIICARRPYGSLIRDVSSPQNVMWVTLMSLAKEKILIVTPTFNAWHAVNCIFQACIRRVHVTLQLTKTFNDKKESLPFQEGTNVNVVRKLQKRLKKTKFDRFLSVEWYVGGVDCPNNHIKFMSVDDKYCVFGNGNMDTQSWYHSMEVNLFMAGNIEI